jgi:hypothetical protein
VIHRIFIYNQERSSRSYLSSSLALVILLSLTVCCFHFLSFASPIPPSFSPVCGSRPSWPLRFPLLSPEPATTTVLVLRVPQVLPVLQVIQALVLQSVPSQVLQVIPVQAHQVLHGPRIPVASTVQPTGSVGTDRGATSTSTRTIMRIPQTLAKSRR